MIVATTEVTGIVDTVRIQWLVLKIVDTKESMDQKSMPKIMESFQSKMELDSIMSQRNKQGDKV